MDTYPAPIQALGDFGSASVSGREAPDRQPAPRASQVGGKEGALPERGRNGEARAARAHRRAVRALVPVGNQFVADT